MIQKLRVNLFDSAEVVIFDITVIVVVNIHIFNAGTVLSRSVK